MHSILQNRMTTINLGKDMVLMILEVKQSFQAFPKEQTLWNSVQDRERHEATKNSILKK